MNTEIKQIKEEEPCQNTFRVTLPDQKGGIFLHEDKAVIRKRNIPHLADAIRPIVSDDIAGHDSRD